MFHCTSRVGHANLTRRPGRRSVEIPPPARFISLSWRTSLHLPALTKCCALFSSCSCHSSSAHTKRGERSNVQCAEHGIPQVRAPRPEACGPPCGKRFRSSAVFLSCTARMICVLCGALPQSRRFDLFDSCRASSAGTGLLLASNIPQVIEHPRSDRRNSNVLVPARPPHQSGACSRNRAVCRVEHETYVWDVDSTPRNVSGDHDVVGALRNLADSLLAAPALRHCAAGALYFLH
jgi:hypothetical protein